MAAFTDCNYRIALNATFSCGTKCKSVTSMYQSHSAVSRNILQKNPSRETTENCLILMVLCGKIMSQLERRKGLPFQKLNVVGCGWMILKRETTVSLGLYMIKKNVFKVSLMLIKATLISLTLCKQARDHESRKLFCGTPDTTQTIAKLNANPLESTLTNSLTSPVVTGKLVSL